MFTININIVMGYNQLARIYRGMGHHGIIRVLRIIFKGHGRAFEGIFLGEGHHESMAVGLPSQRVAFAEINILWTCPINRHYRHGLVPHTKLSLPFPCPKSLWLHPHAARHNANVKT